MRAPTGSTSTRPSSRSSTTTSSPRSPPRRVPDPLPALAVRHGVPAALQGLRYGLQKIYEMVINNDPCYAYLLRCNQLVDQKLVMAHVYGHNDFFKNNVWFSQTNRKMMDEMANHGNRIRSYMERYGEETVENFIDSCLSLENLIDIHSPFIKRRDDDQPLRLRRRGGGRRSSVVEVPEQGLHGPFVNPPDGPQGGGPAAGDRAGRRPSQLPRAARARRPAVPARARPAQALAARRAGDHPRGGVLLRPAGPDQDHERGLGVVLALDDHDPEDPRALGAGRLRRPPLRHDGHPARPAQPVQARHRAVPRHRGALEQGAVRPGVRGVRQLRDAAAAGTSSSAWAARRSSRSAGSTTT